MSDTCQEISYSPVFQTLGSSDQVPFRVIVTASGSGKWLKIISAGGNQLAMKVPASSKPIASPWTIRKACAPVTVTVYMYIEIRQFFHWESLQIYVRNHQRKRYTLKRETFQSPCSTVRKCSDFTDCVGFRDNYEFFGIQLNSTGNNLWYPYCTGVDRRITWTTIPETDVDFFYLHVKAVEQDCMKLFPSRWYSVPKVCRLCNHGMSSLSLA